MNVTQYLRKMADMNASDLHISVGLPPMARVHGRLTPLDSEPLTPQQAESYVHTLVLGEKWEELQNRGESDLAVTSDGLRFRCNAYRERENYACALRLIKTESLRLEQLGLPPILNDLCKLPRGMVLVTGPTGSGKSTTLAAMIDRINETTDAHILTLEDPIEFIHAHKKSMIHQREVGTDTESYGNALRAALREDPDIILVGEMRDLDTIGIALTAAETGHLVFSTLHTIGGAKTIDRVIDVFPPHQQQQIRVQLSTVLQAVVSQQLIPAAGGRGRVCVCEVMTATPALRNLIREAKTPQINNTIGTSRSSGMILMDHAIADAVRAGKITPQEAMEWAVDPEALTQLIRR